MTLMPPTNLMGRCPAQDTTSDRRPPEGDPRDARRHTRTAPKRQHPTDDDGPVGVRKTWGRQRGGSPTPAFTSKLGQDPVEEPDGRSSLEICSNVGPVAEQSETRNDHEISRVKVLAV